MANFVQLTNPEGASIFVNMDMVFLVQATRVQGANTELMFAASIGEQRSIAIIHVKESAEDIANLGNGEDDLRQPKSIPGFNRDLSE